MTQVPVWPDPKPRLVSSIEFRDRLAHPQRALDLSFGVLSCDLLLGAQSFQLQFGFRRFQFDGRFCPVLYRPELLLDVSDVLQKGFSMGRRRLVEFTPFAEFARPGRPQSRSTHKRASRRL